MQNSANKIRNDLILICSILALALAAFLIFKACAKEGNRAVITVNGEVYKYISLDTDATYDVITGENGEFKNTVTVKGGKVSVSYANCPDGVCQKHRAINHSGDSIICLPHRVALTVEIGEENDVDISIR